MDEFQRNLVRSFQMELLNEGSIEFLAAARQLHTIYENLPDSQRTDDPGRDLAPFLPPEHSGRYLFLNSSGQPTNGQEIAPTLQSLLQPDVLETFWAEAAGGGPREFAVDNFVNYLEGRAKAPAMLHVRAYPEQDLMLGMGRLQDITDIRLESFSDSSAAAFERMLQREAGVFVGLVLLGLTLTGLAIQYLFFSPLAKYMTFMADCGSTPESEHLTWKRFKDYATRLQQLEDLKNATRVRLEREIDARYQAESERDALRSNLERTLSESRRAIQNQATHALADLQVALVRRESRVLSNQLLPRLETALHALSEISDPARATDAITMCLSTVRALADLGTDLAPLNLREMPLRPWIETVAGEFSASRSVSLESHVGDDLVARIDPEALRQAIECIMDNAAIATPPGAGIRVDSVRENDWVEIRVVDHGSGIPDEARPHIFLPFYTLASEADGLGLALARSVVKRHGGTIEVHTEVDKGTAVIIRLPAV
jgi:signal transduction histidine kinase